MSQEYKIVSENINSNGGITDSEVTYISTTAATVTFSALTATFYGNGSNLANVTDNYVTGGTYSNGSLILNRQNGSVTINGFSTGTTSVDTYVTGFTYSNNNFIVSQNGGQSPLSVSVNNMTGLTVNGSLSATTYLGLPVDPNYYVTGGTYSNGTLTLNRQDNVVTINNLFTGFTISDGTNTQPIADSNTLQFLAGSGLTTTVSATDTITVNLNITGTTVESSPTNGDKLLIFDTSSGTHKNIDWSQLPGASGGEVNTASNVGGGIEIFKQKSGVDLEFRTLIAGSNITITSGATTLTINSTATGGGGSSRITGSTVTTGGTATVVDSIDTLTNNTTNLIELYLKAYTSGGTQWGVWKRTLTVTKVSNTVTIREENADVDKQSTGLRATSLSFTVNGGNIDVYVTGIAATTINWNSAYEIIL